MKLIVETDLKAKQVRFFLSGRHVATKYPRTKAGTTTTNVYRYISGEIKNLNNKHYFFIMVNTHLDTETIGELTKRAKEIALAQIKLRYNL